MTKTVAQITDAEKVFDKRKVLDNITLSVKTGEILGLIGPSGAGKTTTIKCLMGMESLSSGTAEIFQKRMPNRQVLARIGYMGQSDALYSELTAIENMQFFGDMMGLTGSAQKEAIEQASQLVQLDEFLHVPVKTFSGGMKRRLSLAITLLAKPDLLILDEPTVGIDPRLRIEIWEQLKELANDGKAIIVTTHVMDEAEKCDAVGLIIDGKLIALGTPADLKKNYQVDTIEEVFLKAEAEVNAL